jgi:putative flippase GtrA
MQQFILYCLCGGTGVLSDYAVFWLSVNGGLWYQAANLLGYLAGTLVSFALNRIITFGKRDRVLQRLTMFLTVAAVGFGASALMLWVLVDLMQMDPRIAKLLTLPMVVVLQFTLNRRLTFKA